MEIYNDCAFLISYKAIQTIACPLFCCLVIISKDKEFQI